MLVVTLLKMLTRTRKRVTSSAILPGHTRRVFGAIEDDSFRRNRTVSVINDCFGGRQLFRWKTNALVEDDYFDGIRLF